MLQHGAVISAGGGACIVQDFKPVTRPCLAARPAASILPQNLKQWSCVQVFRRSAPSSCSHPARSRLTRSRAVTVSASSGVLLPLLVPTVLDRMRSSVVSAISFGLVRPPASVPVTSPASRWMHKPVLAAPAGRTSTNTRFLTSRCADLQRLTGLAVRLATSLVHRTWLTQQRQEQAAREQRAEALRDARARRFAV